MLRLHEGGVILTRLSGGLGNQFFQYAAARALAERRRTGVVLDLTWYQRRPKNDTPRAFQLDRFPIQAARARGAAQVHCYMQTLPIVRQVSRLASPWRTYEERGFDFDPRVASLADDSHLVGYWQSHRYFDDIAETIRHELTPAPQRQPHSLEGAMRATNTVSVHVRRGDYATRQHVTAMHGTCSPDYYARAAAHMAAVLGHRPEFFVFSDDPDWAEGNLSLPGSMHVVRHQGEDADLADLRLMSLCHHHIIANSTFSWWSAWLNARGDKQVVAPARWFASGVDTPDLLPASWVRV